MADDNKPRTEAPKPMPKEQQIRPDPANPGYDHPSTFGKGWNR